MSTFYIVTPAFNAVKYIDETIASVISQAGDFSIYYHVQDGGSTDGTIEKLRKWEEKISSGEGAGFCRSLRFTWESAPDNGMYDAVNRGFEKLNPPDDGIMAWVNSDDPYLPRAFSTICRFFSQAPQGEWVGGKVMWLGEDGGLAEVEGHDYYPQEYIAKGFTASGEWWCIQQNGCFWKGSLWKKAGPLDGALRYAADAFIWVAFAQHAYFHHFSVYVGTYRSCAGQLSQQGSYVEEIRSRMGGTRKKMSFLPVVFPTAKCYRSFPVVCASGYSLYGMYTSSAVKHFILSYLRPIRVRADSALVLLKRFVKRCLRLTGYF